MKIAIAVMLCALTFNASARTIHLHNRVGGYNDVWLRDYQNAHRRHQRVVISGYCQSACTLGLKFRNVCVMPSAVVCFHAASGSAGNPWSGEPNAYGTAALSSAVPPELRRRLLPLTTRMQCISARRLPRRYLCK